MTAAKWYLLGLGVVVLGGVLAAALMGSAIWVALGLAVVVQAPLGWWLVRSIGTPRFLMAWAIGMGARVALVVLAGFAVLPALGLPLAAGLIGLAVLLMALLVIELCVVVWAQRSKVEAR